MNLTSPVTIALVDDHKLFRKGLISLIEFVNPEFKILFEADDGNDLKQKLLPDSIPDMIIMDVNMPVVDGYAAMGWVAENFPMIKVLVISMIEKEESILRMLKLGAKGYLTKDVEPQELAEALNAVLNKGYYYTDFITGKLIHSLQQEDKKEATQDDKINLINEQEMNFLKLACSDLTYNEIADLMFLSPKTIDGYRKALFEKLDVKSRVSLALFAVKHALVEI